MKHTHLLSSVSYISKSGGSAWVMSCLTVGLRLAFYDDVREIVFVVYREETYHSTRLPLGLVAEVIEGPHNLQERFHRRLADTFVVVWEQVYQLQCALLNVGEEMFPGSREDRANGIGGNLLLNGDGAVDVKQLVHIKICELYFSVAIRVDNRDGILRRRPGRECFEYFSSIVDYEFWLSIEVANSNAVGHTP